MRPANVSFSIFSRVVTRFLRSKCLKTFSKLFKSAQNAPQAGRHAAASFTPGLQLFQRLRQGVILSDLKAKQRLKDLASTVMKPTKACLEAQQAQKHPKMCDICANPLAFE